MTNQFEGLANGWWKAMENGRRIWLYIDKGTCLGFIRGELATSEPAKVLTTELCESSRHTWLPPSSRVRVKDTRRPLAEKIGTGSGWRSWEFWSGLGPSDLFKDFERVAIKKNDWEDDLELT